MKKRSKADEPSVQSMVKGLWKEHVRQASKDPLWAGHKKSTPIHVEQSPHSLALGTQGCGKTRFYAIPL
jgi:hypothetical protein